MLGNFDDNNRLSDVCLLLHCEWFFIFALKFAVATQPICLHPDRENLIVGKRATIVGWGKMSHSQRQPIMQFLEVPLAAWDQCAKIYGSTGALESPKSVGM